METALLAALLGVSVAAAGYLVRRIDRLDARVIDLTKHVATLTKLVGAQGETLTALTTLVGAQGETLTALTTLVGTQGETLTALTTLVGTQGETLTALTT